MATDMPRYLKKRLEGLKYPQLLILKDKHSTDYYLINDQDALFRACVEILEARFEQQYIYDPGPVEKVYGFKEELTETAANALPAPYKEQALKVIKDNARLRKEHAAQVEQYENAKKAVAEKDGVLAYMILDERRDHEYEGWTLERPRVP